MEKKFDISNENNPIVSNADLIIYEDKSPLIIVDDEKEATEEEKPRKVCRAFGIVSFVFSIFSLIGTIIVAVPTAFNLLSPSITTIPSIVGIWGLPLFFLIPSFLIVFVIFVFMFPAPIIGLIFATVDENKNAKKTFLGEFGNTASLVSLLTMVASVIISVIIYIIPLIISLIINLVFWIFIAAIV